MLVKQMSRFQTVAQRRWIDLGVSSAPRGIVQQRFGSVTTEPLRPQHDGRSRDAHARSDFVGREAVQCVQDDSCAPGDALRTRRCADPSFEARADPGIGTHGLIQLEPEKPNSQLRQATKVGETREVRQLSDFCQLITPSRVSPIPTATLPKGGSIQAVVRQLFRVARSACRQSRSERRINARAECELLLLVAPDSSTSNRACDEQQLTKAAPNRIT